MVLTVIGTTRFATTVYHIEDIDSLRFAMSAIEFDVLNNKPHFPGYPLFVVMLQCIHRLCNSVALSFSFLGVIATTGLWYALAELAKLFRIQGAFRVMFILLVCNPLIWVMGNRYMPDLMGLCVLYWCLVFLLRSLESEGGRSEARWPFFLGVAASVLCGIRLSYLPFLIPGIVLIRRPRQMFHAGLAFFAVSTFWIGVWIYDVGLTELIQLAKHDSRGHFTQWGGTVYSTEVSLSRRFMGLFESLFAHGFGMWMPGRSAWILLNSGILAVFFVSGSWAAWLHQKRHTSPVLLIWLACCFCYAAWAFFFQNITYKPRHILPLLIPVIFVLALGVQYVLQQRKWPCIRRWPELIMSAYIFCGVQIGFQHIQPSAINQLRDYVLASPPNTIVHCPDYLIRYYLRESMPQRTLLFTKHEGELSQLLLEDTDVFVLSTTRLSKMNDGIPNLLLFHHNLYVNRLWSTLVLYEYKVSATGNVE